MRTRIALCLLTVAVLFAGAVKTLAQEKSAITVKGTTLSNGVVVVDVMKGTKAYLLECNQGAPSCTQLKSGKYQLVELPSNTGMYDCKDVQVFPDGADTEDSDKKLGEYCLNDK
jgi:competence protein ComGC